MTEQFIITRDWIFNNRTERGAWTKKQITALGLKWPATSGWIDELVGEAISSHNARLFEEGSSKSKVKIKHKELTINKCIEYLFTNAHKLKSTQLMEIRNIEKKYLKLLKEHKI